MIAFVVTTTTQDSGPPWVQLAVTAIVTVGTIVTAAIAAGVWRRTSEIKRVTDDTNKAVNGVPVGTPRLVERVEILERRHDADGRWMHDALREIGGQLGVTMPNRRDYD